MDTGTHIVMGIALGGLATLDPAVHQDPVLFNAVLAGTILGSQAPDFDTVLKLRNNASYLRNHRGITHSIPAVILWGLAISLLLYVLVPEINFLHLWLWTFGAVVLHVFVDVFNAYGTQAYRPFTRRWVAYGFINTFDPFIFAMNAIGIVLWLIGLDPGPTFAVIYAILVLYYVKRYLDKRRIIKQVKEKIPDAQIIATSPTMKQAFWRVAITAPDRFYVGKVENWQLRIIDEFERKPLPDNELIEVAREDKNIAAFLSFSPVFTWEVNMYDDFTELRLIDLRYHNSAQHYPFKAVVQIDDNNQVMSSYTGWIFSEQKLQRKLVTDDNPSAL